MKRRYTEEQISYALKESECGVKAAEICRKMGVSEQTFYKWKRKYAGMGITELRQLKGLEQVTPAPLELMERSRARRSGPS